jgi:hypothetical protein
MFPKISDWITGTERQIGPLWFNQLNAPLALLLLLLTGIGPLIAWRRASRANLRKQFLWPGVAALLTAGTLLAWFRTEIGFFPLATWSLCCFVVGTIFQEYFRAIRARMRGGRENLLRAFGTLMRKNQRRYGGYVVHLGVVRGGGADRSLSARPATGDVDSGEAHVLARAAAGLDPSGVFDAARRPLRGVECDRVQRLRHAQDLPQPTGELALDRRLHLRARNPVLHVALS